MAEITNEAALASETQRPPDIPARQRTGLMQQLKNKYYTALTLGFMALSSPAKAGDMSVAKPEPASDAPVTKLMLAGGGPTSDLVFDRFVEAAGGPGKTLVYIPTASEEADKEDFDSLWLSKFQKRMRVVILHTRNREEANDPAFYAPLNEAHASWIGGGKQSLLASAYAGTGTEQALHAMYERGSPVGGHSAGAAGMSRLMIVRGKPAETGTGLGLIADAVVDTHFLERLRLERLQTVIQENPNHWGFGVDQGAALFVHTDARQRMVEALGEQGKECVWLCDGTQNHVLRAGDKVNLSAFTMPPQTAQAGGR